MFLYGVLWSTFVFPRGRRTNFAQYEPWVIAAIAQFEREMEAYYKRAQFEIV